MPENPLYGLYERRIVGGLDPSSLPRHVGVILDGNRRWAKEAGSSVVDGHRRGGDHVLEFLGWCDEVGIGMVTLWMLSTDNFDRPSSELSELIDVIERTVTQMAATSRWRIKLVGALELLPERTARLLGELERATEHVEGLHVNVAVGYGGRQEIADAVRSLLKEHAAKGLTVEEVVELITIEHIGEYLYTRGQPDPDLVIRTSGEQRLSGFLLWQSAHSEFYFCEAYWPDFRRVDFLRALRDYVERERRFGA